MNWRKGNEYLVDLHFCRKLVVFQSETARAEYNKVVDLLTAFPMPDDLQKKVDHL